MVPDYFAVGPVHKEVDAVGSLPIAVRHARHSLRHDNSVWFAEGLSKIKGCEIRRKQWEVLVKSPIGFVKGIAFIPAKAG